ncbi:MAG TPA: hypothetical protein VE988_06795 [Gemmataceae bacterium]|nr:hypothetical protein [Gemmataceae bacterium]
MDALRGLLEDMKRSELDHGHLLGLFHLLIGRRLATAEGAQVSSGLTWREMAKLLQKARWPKDAVRELGLEPVALPPRDRQQYWYLAITLAGVDGDEAKLAGDRLAALLEPLGYRVT